MARSASSRAEEASRRREVEQAAGHHRHGGVQLERRQRRRERDGRVLADDLARHLLDRLGDDRVDLAGHDRAARLQRRERDLGQPRRGAGAQEPQVAGDLVEREGDDLARWRWPRPPRPARTGPRSGPPPRRGAGPCRRRGWRCTPRANRGGALRPVPTAVPPRGSSPRRGSTSSRRSRASSTWRAQPAASWPKVTGAASIRWVRPALTVRTWRAGQPAQLGVQVVEGGDQLPDDHPAGGQPQRGREHVVRRLGGVDVVVGVHRPAEALGGHVGQHLVGVHVGARAGAGLEDVEREVVVEARRRTSRTRRRGSPRRRPSGSPGGGR